MMNVYDVFTPATLGVASAGMGRRRTAYLGLTDMCRFVRDEP